MFSRTERTYYVCGIIVCQLFWLSQWLLIMWLLLDVLLCLCDHNLHCFSHHGVCRFQDEELVLDSVRWMPTVKMLMQIDNSSVFVDFISIQFCFVIRQL